MEITLYLELLFAGMLSAIIIGAGYRRDDWLLQSIGLGLLIITLLFLFLYKPEYASVFAGLAAIIVAIGAFTSIEESRRLRRESLTRESRDRTERLYDSVLRWAMDILRAYTSLSQICVVFYNEAGRPFVEDEESRSHELYSSRLLNSFQALRDEGKYVTKIAPRVGVRTGENASELWQLLTNLIRLLDSLRIGVETDTNIPSIVEIDKAIDRIAPLCNEIIAETAEAKLSLAAIDNN
jgi:hypothetical protein